MQLLATWFFNATGAADAGADAGGAGACGGLPCNAKCANPETTCPYEMNACRSS